MLRYSTNPFRAPTFPLSFEEDQTLRKAFGNEAKAEFRRAGENIVAAHQAKDHWLHCDCQSLNGRSPTLFLVEGRHIRRETQDRPGVTPHTEDCDFFRISDEQIDIVRSYRKPPADEYFKLNLVNNFTSTSTAVEYPHTKIVDPRDGRKDSLAQTLCRLLHEAELDRFSSTAPLRSDLNRQFGLLMYHAERFSVGANHSLKDNLGLGLAGYYELKKRLEQQLNSEWKRPAGLFIGTFSRIENKTLYPDGNGKPLTVIGRLSVFGERDRYARPPYVVAGLVTQPTRASNRVELQRAYAHPCVAWNQLTLVDSQLERETLELLMASRDWLARQFGVSVVIEKPIFDVGPPETGDARPVYLPDFILHCSGRGVQNPKVIVETMGSDSPNYRIRKQRMHALFANIGDGPHPVPVIQHDRFKSGSQKSEIDFHFRQAVCGAIMGRTFGRGPRPAPSP